MLCESTNKNSRDFKPVLLCRRKKKHDDRQALYLSILSLIPEDCAKPTQAKQSLLNKFPRKKQFNTKIDASNDPKSSKNIFLNAYLYKKSSQKQKKIFSKLKVNNQRCIRKVSNIIFKTQIDDIINKIEKRALSQNRYQDVSQQRNTTYSNKSFRLSDACRISNMKINNNRSSKWENFSASLSYRHKSTSITRSKVQQKSLRSNLRTIDKNWYFKKQELRGWQSTPKHFLTHYESGEFDEFL